MFLNLHSKQQQFASTNSKPQVSASIACTIDALCPCTFVWTTTTLMMTTATTEEVNLSADSNAGSNADGSDEADWQQVPSKRKNCGSPNIFKQKRPHHDDEPSTSNRFSSLANDDSRGDAAKAAEVQPKPPPIFVPYVGDIDKMIIQISKCIQTSEFNYKSLRDGQVKLSIKTVDSYRKVVKLLESEGKSYHTFQLKPDRAFRVVIKGLHHSTNISDIKAHLLSLGHQVRSVRNIISRNTKIPLPMFYVDIDPSPNNTEIFNIRSFDNAIINIVEPKKYDDIVQCFRCQEFGHTKSYCRKPYRCVKCGLEHSTTVCNKAPSTPPKCVHCNENHTSSYKGCKYYQSLINRRTTRIPRNNVPVNFANNDFSQVNSTNFQNTMSYSQALKGDENILLKKIEVMLEKQIELTNTLINMMSMLISKICN